MKIKRSVQTKEVTVAQVKQTEYDADAAGLSYTQMMENAGQTAAVFCGTGNKV